jgi:chitin disaccharide deacetylase
MNPARRLIVNADDFGLSEGVNLGIVQAHREGIVTSASLMVRWAAAEHAVSLASVHPLLGLGIHFDLGEWFYDSGEWKPRYAVADMRDAVAVQHELDAQLERFERLVGRPPTHLDSHQHVHHDAIVLPIVVAASHRLGIPVRGVAPGPSYCGDFYGQDGRGYPFPEAISGAALTRIIETLPPGDTELACHPGFDGDLDTTYRDERAREVAALCDAGVRRAVRASNVELISFAPLRRITPDT